MPSPAALAPPGTRPSPEDRSFPLSSVQQDIWLDQLLHWGEPLYNIGAYARIEGELDAVILDQALQTLVRRHDALRIVLVETEGSLPLQEVLEDLPISLRWIDFSESADPHRTALEWMARRLREPFALYGRPLFEFVGVRVGGGRCYLFQRYHHLIVDGWSNALISRALAEIYAQLLAGEKPATNGHSYRDFVRDDQSYQASPQFQEHGRYWREKSQPRPEPLFPARPTTPGGHRATPSACSSLTLPRAHYDRLTALGRDAQASTFHVLLGALYVYFTRTRQRNELTVGLPTLNRRNAAFKATVGLFVSVNAARFQVSGELSFSGLLGELGKTLRQDYRRQRYPLGELTRALGAQRNGHGRMFDLSLSYEKHDYDYRFGANRQRLVPLSHNLEQTPLAVYVREYHRDEDVQIDFVHNLADWTTAEIEALKGRFSHLLEGILAAPHAPVCRLSLVPDFERKQLAEWNRTEREYDASRTLVDLFEKQVERKPDAVAVVFGEEEVSYAELNARANRLAHELIAAGVGAESLVGICVQRSVEMVVGLLGILKAGGAYVPLDPDYPAERLGFMVADSGIKLIISQKSVAERLPVSEARVVWLEKSAEDLTQLSSVNPARRAGPENLAYVIYTSGSTGRPKGVMIEHCSLRNMALASGEAFAADSSSRVLQFASLSFDVSVSEMAMAFVSGGRLHLGNGGRFAPDEDLVRLLEKQRISHLSLPASILSRLPQSSLPALKTLIAGGEPCPGELPRRWAAGRRFFNAYGPTEGTVCASFSECLPDTQRPSIGRPMPNTLVHVLDEYQQLVPVGATGELYLGGVQLARGYLKRPELTAERFVEVAAESLGREGGESVRLYRTGDLARWRPEGELEYLGRADQQVKLRGYRIELGEIEAVLAEHPMVKEAVVVLDTEAENARLVAYVTSRREASAVLIGELRTWVKGKLPEYMVPAAWQVLDELPLTPNGKVDRRALPKVEMAPATSRYEGPRTAAEETLVRIWSEVLKRPGVGIHDNFFELGGDSILSIQVVAKGRAAGLRLSPRDVFERQTVAELALAAELMEEKAIEQGQVTGAVELTPIQARFFAEEPAEPWHFNQAVLLAVKPGLDREALQRALSAILEHHDALRLRYARRDGRWEQWHAEEMGELPYAEEDLRGVVGAERKLRLEERADAWQASLDLERGPLMRMVWFDLGAEARLLWCIHHLAVDGVSWRILLEDLAKSYEQASRGEAVKLPAKSSSFQAWSARLQQWSRSASFAEERARWLALEPAAPLPLDHPGEVNRVADTRHYRLEFDEATTRALLQESPAAYRTGVNDLLLTALVLSLREWTGQNRQVIDLESHGRAGLFAELDLSRTVGWFTSLHPVELAAPAGGGLDRAIKSVKERLRQVRHEGVAYGILRYAHGEPLPHGQVLFNYLGQWEEPAGGRFGFAEEKSGRSHSVAGERSHLIEINGQTTGGRLSLDWSYSGRQYEGATIERLAQSYREQLQAVIAHCRVNFGCTPGDFPLAQLSQAEVDGLMERYGRNLATAYPLSPMQQGMLFHTLYGSAEGQYFEQTSFLLEGRLNRRAFRQAWEQLVAEHAVLRTAFVWEKESMLQVVCREAELPWEEWDWGEDEPAEQQRKLQALLAEERKRGFDLSRAPLMRLQLIREGENRHRVVWHFHHGLMDGWSLPVLWSQWEECYRAHCDGERARLPALRPYQDYIGWLQAQDPVAAREYWLAQLAGVTAPTELTVGCRADPQEPARPRRVDLELAPEEHGELERFGRKHRLTLNTLVQGAWALLLSRYSGSGEVIFGATSSGRQVPLAGIERMVGLFINTLPLRVRTSEVTDVPAWLREIQEQQQRHERHAHVSLAEIQSWSGEPKGTALFESVLVFENYPMEAGFGQLEAGRLRVSEVQAIEYTNYALTLAIMPGPPLRFSLTYDERRFEAESMGRMLEHLRRLLRGMVAEPQCSIHRLGILTGWERKQLTEWNRTDRPYDTSQTLVDLFEAQVARSPDAVAVVLGDEKVSYAELNARANRLAHELIAAGVGAESLVGICVERSVEMVVGLLGILKAGGAYVPLDPDYPAERLGFMVADSGIKLLLSQKSVAERLPASEARVLWLEQGGDNFMPRSASNPLRRAGPLNLAYVIYTSGSTGKPKGIMIEHRSVANLTAELHRAVYTRDERRRKVAWMASVSFDASVQQIFGCLLHGDALCLVEERVKREPGELLGFLKSKQIELSDGTPTLLGLLLDAGLAEEEGLALEHLLIGGEALPPALVRRLAEGATGRRIRLVNVYGPTECTVDATVFHVELRGTHSGSTVPIGRPIANTQVYVLDEDQQLVPIGVAGELYIGGAGLARGYLKRPELTAERFVEVAAETLGGEGCGTVRLYRTGDLARWRPEGELEYLGRVGQQVKLRGYRIELGEIESVLAEHPMVKEAVVVLDNEGENARLVAYVTSRREASAELIGELRSWVKGKLPEYMVPAAWQMLEALPLTPNGKVDRRALPKVTASELTAGYEPPRDEVEALLANLWSEVLGVEKVGRTGNFFELGGHSLLATQLAARVRGSFGTELPLRVIFEEPVLSGQAQWLARKQEKVSWPELEPMTEGTGVPLSFAQQRLWFLSQLEGPSATYNVSGAVRLEGELSVTAMRAALRWLMERHRSLRQVFPTVDGAARVVELAVYDPLEEIDLRGHTAEEKSTELARLSREEAVRPFNLGRGPLWRARLLRVDESEQVLLFNLHHIVTDGWSMGVLVKELSLAYASQCEGIDPKLPALPVQYGDYAAWQRGWLQGEILAEQLEYWRKQLDGLPERLELPVDHPRPAVQSYRGARHVEWIEVELTKKLQELGRRQGATLFMTLLAAYAVLLGRMSGQRDVAIGTPIANRRHRKTEGLIGFFVNTLVLRNRWEGEPGFAELLAEVRRVCLEAYAHQDIPFEHLVEQLQPQRSLSHAPLFQVMFVLQNTPPVELELPGVKASILESDSGVAKFDLTLSVEERDGRLCCSWEYASDLWETASIARMSERYRLLLAAIAAEPERSIHRLEILTGREREQLAEWNRTERAYDSSRTLVDLFEAQVARSPDAVAVVLGDEEVSYAELNARANRLAHELIAAGVGAESLVGICVDRSVEMVVGLLGILKAGGAYVPLDPDYPAERLAFMMADSGIKLLLSRKSVAERLPAGEARVVWLEKGGEDFKQCSAANPARRGEPNNLAYVIYTSGSTGRPKGVMIEHRGLSNLAEAIAEGYGVGAASRVLQFASLSFDASVAEIAMTFIRGGRLHLGGGEPFVPDENFVRQLEIERITHVTLPPSILARMPEATLPALGYLIAAGEPCPGEMIRRWANGRRFLNGYGPTEFTVCATFSSCEPGCEKPSIGRPMANTTVYVLDEYRQLAPIGVAGELYLGGVQLARGYLKRPELTAERFVEVAAESLGREGGESVRLYRTGDLARWRPEGELEYLGRADQQVKLRGYRIELGEIEAVLAEHPMVKEAVVVPDTGAENARLVAYVTSRRETSAELLAELRTWVKGKLPEYMVPAAWQMLDALPLTPNGKVDRRALPKVEMAAATSRYEGPRTAAEETLARIWSEVLKRPGIGIHDNFFELGGDSILSIQVVAKGRAAGLRLSPRDVFERQTVAELALAAELMEERAIEQGRVSGPVELTPIQARFFAAEPAEPWHFNQAMLLAVEPGLDRKALRQALAAILEQHDALRLRYARRDGRWEQWHAEEMGELPYAEEDLRGVVGAERKLRLEERANAWQARLDLERGPLMRMVWFDLGAGARLLWCIHHLVVDGVSWRILLEDLAKGYEQASRGEAVKLPAKSSSFQAWSARLQQWSRSASFAEERARWLALEPAAPLPLDHPGEVNRVADTRHYRLEFDEATTRALLQESPAAYRTGVNDLLLTALVLSLREWTGQNRQVIDLESHGRAGLFAELDLSRTVGWFTSLHPVELAAPAGGGLDRAIKSVKERLRQVRHEGVAYGILRYAHGEPLPHGQVLFNYLGQWEEPAGGRFGFAEEKSGRSHSVAGERSHLIEINGQTTGGRLSLDWSYSGRQYEGATIERLAQSYREQLQAVIAHCRVNFGCTPGDFPLAQLSQAEVDGLMERYGRNLATAYPLSPMQQGMLFHTLYGSAEGQYFEQTSFLLEGRLNRRAFRQAWEQLVAEHAVLRTAFVWEKESMLQVVCREAELPWEECDWREDEPAEQQRKLQALLAEERKRGFDLSRAPLMRLQLIREGENRHRVVWHFHHGLMDGWSLPVLWSQWEECYRAHCDGERARLPALRPYQDYIGWLQAQDPVAAREYWLAQLAGVSAPTELTVGRRADPQEPARPQRVDLELAPEEHRELERFGRKHRLTLNTLVQGAWALLLSRYSGSGEVIFGATSSGRQVPLAGIERMVGLFINTLPLRVRTSEVTEVPAWLRELQEQQQRHERHAHVSLAEIQSWSGVPKGTALFESVLVFENYPMEAGLGQLEAGRLRVNEVQAIEYTNYALTLAIMPGPPLRFSLTYDERRFEAESIGRMLEHLRRLLRGMVAEPQGSIHRLEILSEWERKQLAEWNRTERAFDGDQTLVDLFEAQVTRSPDAVAVVFGDEEVSYAELNARANRLAHELIAAGAGAESLVGICLERSVEMVVGLLGILKAGEAYVPLDPDYPAERLGFMVADSGIKLLLSQKSVAERLPASEARVVWLEKGGEDFKQRCAANPAWRAGPENLAYVIYTSGSTGKPKGVMIEQRSLLNYVTWAATCYLNETTHCIGLCTSLAFDLTVTSIFTPLISGKTIRVIADDRNGGGMSAVLMDDSVEVLKLTPSHFRFLEDSRGRKVRVFVIGGEDLKTALAQEMLDRCEGRTRIFNEYGPTEATVGCTAALFDPAVRSSSVPIGQPIANTQVYVLDEYRQLAPIGVAGELYIGGAGLARGYLKRPELTAERFVEVAAKRLGGEGGGTVRLYRTGDLGRWRPEGELEYLGRIDQQVKLRGYRIELGEIEAVLAEHPMVKEAVVVLDTGEENARLVAYVTSRREASAELIGELRTWVQKKLPEYMVPAAWQMLDALPLTPNGKVDRRGLPKLAAGEWTVGYEPPRDEVETLLANLWSEVLSVERVGRTANFFELGGHSLLATQLAARVRGSFGTELPLRVIFEEPVLSGQAQWLARKQEKVSWPELEPMTEGTGVPLSFAQQRLWFLSQLEGPSATYNLSGAVRLEGELNVSALRAALRLLTDRHRSLRQVFPALEGHARVVELAVYDPLEEIDLRGHPAEEKSAEVARLSGEEAGRPFDLGRGPLLRVRLLRVDEREQVLLFNLHHIVTDGWSMGVLIRELSVAYASQCEGIDPNLPALAVQYGDYAAWQRGWLQGGVLAEQIEYWRKQLAGLPERLELPSDHARPAVQSYRGARHVEWIEVELTNQLRTLGRRQGATLFMTLLAAYAVLLGRMSGQRDVGIGTPIANRRHRKTEGLIGFFVNTLVLRSRWEGEPGFSEFLAQVRRVCLEAYAHQDIPFEHLVEQLQPQRSLSHASLFQVMFVLQNTPPVEPELPGVKVSILESDSGVAKFDLTLSVEEREGRLYCSWEYASDLWEAASIARMSERYRLLLAAIVAEPQQSIHQVEILTGWERKKLTEWNRTERAYDTERTLVDLFEAQVARSPDSVAVVFGDEEMSYQELNARANRLAHALIAAGVSAESLVGICVQRSVEMVVGLLGILKAGGAYVPLDPDYPAERLAFMVADSGITLLLSQKSVAERLPASKARVIWLEQGGDNFQPRSASNLPRRAGPQNLAYVIYTSGSTGKPKGIMIEHRSVANLAAELHRAVYTRDGRRRKVAWMASVSFDASVQQLFGCLLHGDALCLVEERVKREPRELLGFLKSRRIELCDGTPTLLGLLLDAGLAEEGSLALEHLLIGGEALPPALVRRLAEGASGRRIRLINVYGPAECTVDSTVFRVELHATPSASTVPIGRPIANTQAYVLDECRQPLPIGVAGELYIGGAGLARGYLKRPELTAERFVEVEAESLGGAGGRNVRLYRTGDLARWLPDGELEYLGRVDQQVKLRGYRIELGEIEAVLAEHASVKEAVVMLDTEGENARLVAYVTSRRETSAELLAELGTWVKGKLPEYMVPAAWEVLDELPLTPNGKVDRRALPKVAARDLTVGYEPPRDQVELDLVRIWERLLDVQPIGITDNFFNLGGHSLVAVRLMSQIQQTFGRQLPLATLFQNPTIARLSELLRRDAGPRDWPLLVPIQSQGNLPPLFFLPGVGGNVLYLHSLAGHLGHDRPFYGLPTPGLDGVTAIPDSVEALAAEFLDHIRRVQPRGPYHLGGHSAGGRVAFELARQLEAAGEPVAGLMILDSSAPAGNGTSAMEAWDETDWLWMTAQFLEELTHVPLGITPAALRSEPDLARRYAKVMEPLQRAGAFFAPGAGSGQLHAFVKVYQASVLNNARYRPNAVIGSTITLFRAENSTDQADGASTPDLGWQGFTRQPVRVIRVPGTHISMMQKPAVKILAARMGECLSEVPLAF